jgi:2,3,4,5-tetrahydropyridine-2-carboxylate N-succinyltransferase
VSGSLPSATGRSETAGQNKPSPNLYCAVIVKRVDEKTRAKTSINELLRD